MRIATHMLLEALAIIGPPYLNKAFIAAQDPLLTFFKYSNFIIYQMDWFTDYMTARYRGTKYRPNFGHGWAEYQKMLDSSSSSKNYTIHSEYRNFQKLRLNRLFPWVYKNHCGKHIVYDNQLDPIKINYDNLVSLEKYKMVKDGRDTDLQGRYYFKKYSIKAIDETQPSVQMDVEDQIGYKICFPIIYASLVTMAIAVACGYVDK